MYAASVVENPLVIGGLLLAGFIVLMLLIAIAYYVIKSVFSLRYSSNYELVVVGIV